MKIKRITKIPFSGKVYNIGCGPSHTYFAENILVHNCDVPNIPFNGNVSFDDLKKQLYKALSVFPDVTYTDRLNVHFARMGEPTANLDVFYFSEWLANSKDVLQRETGMRIEVIHPVLTTACPKFKQWGERILRWADIKNNLFNGQAGLQFSINTTSDEQRDKMFGGSSRSLTEIAAVAEKLPEPLSRKYCLNIAFATGNEVDGEKLAKLFDKNKWMVKITPIHNNNACRENGIVTAEGYESYQSYREPEESCKAAGFDTLVFIPSQEEEDFLVTCGNAILGGSEFKTRA